MNEIDQISVDKIKTLTHKIGLRYNLRDEIITKIINSPYKFTRDKISHLEMNDDITEEEYNKLKTNFIYPFLGKLYTNFDMCTKYYNYRKCKKEKI